MVSLELENFDLKQIAASGQCFRIYDTGDNEFVAVSRDKAVTMQACDRGVRLRCAQEEYEGIWKKYFDFDFPYWDVIKRAGREGDRFVLEAAIYGSGIRILRQDLWETVISFLIARCKNISGISGCIEKMCRTYGRAAHEYKGKWYYSFPEPHAIAEAGLEPLLRCGLGFRAKDILKISKQTVNGEFDLEHLRALPRQQAYEYLLQFDGIGPKVANCILLYGLHYIDSVPEDVWIKRIRQEEYGGAEPWWYSDPCAGVIQQWVFYYKRTKGAWRHE